MTRIIRASAAAFALTLTLGQGGCSDSSSDGSRGAAATTPAGERAPFTVVASYSQESLGMRDPRAVALGPDGNLYLTDGTDHLTVVSRSGQVLRRWGGRGSAAGQFRFISFDPSDPTDTHGRITVADDGTVYVSDSGNARVEEFTATGKYLRSFGAAGNQPGQFLSPFDLVTDETKNLYVLDAQLGTLTKFSPAGRVLWRVGGADSQDPDLVGQLHVSVIDAHRRLVLTDDDRSGIVLVDEDGRKVDSFGSRDEGTGGACDATVDKAGNVYIIRCGAGGGGAVLDAAHRMVTRWSTIDGRKLLYSPRFAPDGLGYSIATDGSLVVLRPTSG